MLDIIISNKKFPRDFKKFFLKSFLKFNIFKKFQKILFLYTNLQLQKFTTTNIYKLWTLQI